MGIALAWDLDRSVKAERELLLAYSGVFAAAVSPSMADGDRIGAQVAMTSISKLPRVNYARLESPDGSLWVDIGTDYILEGKSVDISKTASLMAVSSQRLSVSSDVVRGGVRQGRVVMYSDASFLRSKLLSGLGAALILAIIATGLTSAICIILLRSTIRPIETLTTAITSMATAIASVWTLSSAPEPWDSAWPRFATSCPTPIRGIHPAPWCATCWPNGCRRSAGASPSSRPWRRAWKTPCRAGNTCPTASPPDTACAA